MSVSINEIATRGTVAHRSWPRVERRARLLGFLPEVGLLAALYYGSAKLGYELGFSGPVAAIVWLPVGVGIAYLYLRGLAFWPGVLLGDLLANDYSSLTDAAGEYVTVSDATPAQPLVTPHDRLVSKDRHIVARSSGKDLYGRGGTGPLVTPKAPLIVG